MINVLVLQGAGHRQPSGLTLFQPFIINFRIILEGTPGLEPWNRLGLVCVIAAIPFVFFQKRSLLHSVICQLGETAKCPGILEWLTQFRSPGQTEI